MHMVRHVTGQMSVLSGLSGATVTALFTEETPR
jgi:hypothetical protein